jgi:cholestenol Delta-isomerase
MVPQQQQQMYALHPYYPLEIVVPGYVANETPLPILAAAFAGLLGSVIGAALLLSRRSRANGNMNRLEVGEHALICWFVLCMLMPAGSNNRYL